MIRFLMSLVFVLSFAQNSNASSEDNFNFRFNPVFLLVGMVDLNLDYKIHPNWTLGPEVSYWNYKDTHTEGYYDMRLIRYSVGARANWFKSGVYNSSFYIAPALNYVHAKAKTLDTSTPAEGTAEGLVATAIFGYSWFWDSFNMMLGGGLNVTVGDGKVKVTDSSGRTTESRLDGYGLAFEYSLGWTF